MTKLCEYCNQERPIDRFGTAGIVKGKRYYRNKCNICRREDYNKRKERNRDLVRQIKEDSSCDHCGFDDPRALDFHHRDPNEKLYEVSVLANGTYSTTMILEEIEKCDILCANCHRIEHYIAP